MEGIQITQAHLEFRRKIKELKEQGIILAINSKNNSENVEEVLEKRSDMILKKADFAAMRVNWQDKASNMKELAEELDIGIDSFVFLDDNPRERALVANLLPEVFVPNPLEGPSQYANFLPTLTVFEKSIVTEEDGKRTEFYAAGRLRKELREKSPTLEDFLMSLGIKALIGKAEKEDAARVAQLTQRTNQFNITGKRYSEDDIIRFIDNADADVYMVKASDRFGDFGIIGCIILEYEDHPPHSFWKINNFCLSCRALSLGIDQAFISQVIAMSRFEHPDFRLKMPRLSFQANWIVENFFRDIQFPGGNCIYGKNSKPIKVPPWINIQSIDSLGEEGKDLQWSILRSKLKEALTHLEIDSDEPLDAITDGKILQSAVEPCEVKKLSEILREVQKLFIRAHNQGYSYIDLRGDLHEIIFDSCIPLSLDDVKEIIMLENRLLGQLMQARRGCQVSSDVVDKTDCYCRTYHLREAEEKYLVGMDADPDYEYEISHYETSREREEPWDHLPTVQYDIVLTTYKKAIVPCAVTLEIYDRVDYDGYRTMENVKRLNSLDDETLQIECKQMNLFVDQDNYAKNFSPDQEKTVKEFMAMDNEPLSHIPMGMDIGSQPYVRSLHNVHIKYRNAENAILALQRYHEALLNKYYESLIAALQAGDSGTSIKSLENVIRVRQDLNFILKAREKFVKLGWPCRHSHTNFEIDDGDLSPIELVEHAINNGITMLYITGHDSLEGSIQAMEFAKTIDYIIEIKPAVEIETPFEDKHGDLFGFMHWRVLGPNDADRIKEMRELIKDIDRRLEIFLGARFERILSLADEDNFGRLVTEGIIDKLKKHRDVKEGSFISPGGSYDKIKKNLFAALSELKSYVTDPRQKQYIPPYLNKLNLIGSWTGSQKANIWGDEGRDVRRTLRALSDIVSNDRDIFTWLKNDTHELPISTQEALRKFSEIGCYSIAAHPALEINKKDVGKDEYIELAVEMAKEGMLQGAGRGWNDDRIEIDNMTDRIADLSGTPFRKDGSNPDFHGPKRSDIRMGERLASGGYAQDGEEPDREGYFIESRFLIKKYVGSIKDLIRRGEHDEAVRLIRVVSETDSYGHSDEELLRILLDELAKHNSTNLSRGKIDEAKETYPALDKAANEGRMFAVILNQVNGLQEADNRTLGDLFMGNLVGLRAPLETGDKLLEKLKDPVFRENLLEGFRLMQGSIKTQPLPQDKPVRLCIVVEDENLPTIVFKDPYNNLIAHSGKGGEADILSIYTGYNALNTGINTGQEEAFKEIIAHEARDAIRGKHVDEETEPVSMLYDDTLDIYDAGELKVLWFDVLNKFFEEGTVYKIRYDKSRLSLSQRAIIEEYVRLLNKKTRCKFKAIGSSKAKNLINVYREDKAGNVRGEGHVDVDIPEGYSVEQYMLRITGMLNIALAAANINSNRPRERSGPVLGFIRRQCQLIVGSEIAIPESLSGLVEFIKNLPLPKAYRIPAEKIEEYNRLAVARISA